MNDFLPNIPRNFTAIAESLACLFLILQLDKSYRKKSWQFAYLGMFLGQLTLQWFAGTLPLIFWIPGMVLNIAWMLLTFVVTTRLPFTNQLYGICKAFILAEFIAALSWQLYCHFLLPFSLDANRFVYPFMILSYILWLLIYQLIETKSKQPPISIFLRKRELIAACLTAVIVFSMSNIGFTLSYTAFAMGNSSTIFVFRTLINLCGIFILYIQEKQRYETHLKNELSSIRNVLQSQYEQYEAYRESTELVNQKFHDLKHQLDIIQLESNNEKQKKYLSQLQQELQKSQFTIKTGNPIVDTILTRKNMYSLQHGITFTCIADGSLLNFMNEMDICSLLGNALDNAIESSLQQQNTEQRLIHMKIMKKNNFVLFTLENYADKVLQFENGIPKTTKQDKNYHGYGLKSISYIIDKYDGSLTLKHRDNWFVLNALLPISESNLLAAQKELT